MITKKTRKGLGKRSSFLLSTLAESNKNIFSINDAVKVLKEKRTAAAKLLHDMAENKWILRITKGKYLILPLEAGAKPNFTEHEFVIASHFVNPYYISYWSALNYYGLTEQVPRTVFVATTKRKLKTEAMGVTFKFITIKDAKFFGFKEILISNHMVNIAEMEKSIIDCLDMPRNCGGVSEVVKALDAARDEINFVKLQEYAKRMGNSAILSRLGFILDLLGIKTSMKTGRNYVPLDPLLKRKGIYNPKWKVIENISRKELLSLREH